MNMNLTIQGTNYHLPSSIAMTSPFYERDYEGAKREVLEYLRLPSSQKIYVGAWKGVGATALLREVAEVVESNWKDKFETVIKVVRPAPFENPREIQRAVTKQLNLPPSVTTDILDKQDEDDDFRNVEEFSSRDMDTSITYEINRAVRNRKVLLVLCNNIADDNLIDPNELGIPFGNQWISNAVLWTTGMNISSEAASASADYRLRIEPSNILEALDLVCKEAVGIARYIEESSGGSLRTTPESVLRCFWYCLLLLCTAFNRSGLILDDDHNYFVCEGILQGDDAAWEIGRALAPLIGPIIKYQLQYWQETFSTLKLMEKKELLPPRTLIIVEKLSLEEEAPIIGEKLSLEEEEEEEKEPSSEEEEKKEPSSKVEEEEEEEEKSLSLESLWEEEPSWEKLRSEEESYRWISVRSPQNNNPEPWDFFKIYRMSEVSSFFGHFEKTHQVDLPDDFFDHFSNIRVLDLLGCIVCPINSSFLRLRNLRMLRLDQCSVVHPSSLSSAQEEKRQQQAIFFDSLWVLNLYNSDAHTFLLAGKAFELMPNLRVLHLAEQINTEFLPRSLSMAINLKELILTDCKGLQYLNFNLPTTIETISLRSCSSLEEVELVDPSTAAPLPNLKSFHLSHSKLIAKLSLQGCRKLENVDLQELTVLKVLNLSCTAIKVVDITKLPQLKQLFLLGCEQLRRVVGLDKGPELDVLYLDNYNNSSACDVDHCLDSFRNQSLPDLTKGTNDADQRLFQAHVVVRDVRICQTIYHAFLDLSISRAKALSHIHVKSSSTTKKGINIGTTTKSNATITSALCYADVLNTMTDRHRRHQPSPPTMPLNNHIEVDGGDDSRIVEEHRFRDIMKFANSLFVHDNTSNFALYVEFKDLKCLCIERCPNLELIFSWVGASNSLESIWLSQLPKLKALREERWILGQLKHIYLEFCTRLEYVLSSLSELHNLETINIRYCNDLTAIFIGGVDPMLLPKLRSIHLQELPKLQHIYKLNNIRAPSLEELKIRGCFNLRKLPIFDRSDADSMRAVKISCEKDWWKKLQWDGLESNHHASLFNPKHCPYYKKPMKARYL